MEEELEDKCMFHKISRNVRILELKRETVREATIRYREIGCYDCDGNNRTCPIYFNTMETYRKGLNSKYKEETE